MRRGFASPPPLWCDVIKYLLFRRSDRSVFPPCRRRHSVLFQKLAVEARKVITDKFRDLRDRFRIVQKQRRREQRYNWIHAYPNAAAEVVALWFGEGDFDETMHISAMQGYDVDCNAAQIASVVAIASRKNVPAAWRDPIGDELITYMRKIKKVSIRALAKKTVRLGAL